MRNHFSKLVLIAALTIASVDVFGQGVTTNNYAGTGPQGPFTLANQPLGLGGAPKYFNYGWLNLSTSTNATAGTNAAGVYTNTVLANTTTSYTPANGQTTFVCADYDSVDFQLQALWTNSGTLVSNRFMTATFALSRDGTNWESSPTNVVTFPVPTNGFNTSGPIVWGTTIPTSGAYAVALLAFGNTNASTALTNLLANNTNSPISGYAGGAFFSAKAARKHVNWNQN